MKTYSEIAKHYSDLNRPIIEAMEMLEHNYHLPVQNKQTGQLERRWSQKWAKDEFLRLAAQLSKNIIEERELADTHFSKKTKIESKVKTDQPPSPWICRLL